MTIMDAINRIDILKPNRYEIGEKIKWLNALDERIKQDIVDTHEGAEGSARDGYTEETDLMTILLVPSPFDELYLYWLESQINYWNGETPKYNNSIEMFNTAYTAFANHYNRTHKPKGRKLNFF